MVLRFTYKSVLNRGTDLITCLVLSISCSLDVWAELKFCCIAPPAFSTCAVRHAGCVAARREQWCHSVCHLKQRCQMRQWRIKYRLYFCHPSSQPFIFFLFLESPSIVFFSHFLLVSLKASSRLQSFKCSSTSRAGCIARRIQSWINLVYTSYSTF